jgi:chromosome segregation ATPase
MSPRTNAEPFCRRQSITFQKTELEQLESKLREMEVELEEKQSQLPLMSHNSSGSGRGNTQRRKGLEAVLEPEARAPTFSGVWGTITTITVPFKKFDTTASRAKEAQDCG